MASPNRHHSVAVLILNFNGLRFLRDCFSSVLQSSYPSFDVFMIDNDSSDGSVPWTRAHFPAVHIIKNHENYGFAKAYDGVIRELEHKYVVLLNNDTAVESKWLGNLVEAAERDRRIAACGSKILMMWNRKIIDHGGGLLTWIGSGLDLGKWTEDRGQFDEEKETGFACGASLLLRREAYLEIGGFDTSYHMYHEDVDLCWRLRLRGYSVMYVPSSVVYHHLGGGLAKAIDTHPLKTYASQRNRLANVIKDLTAGYVPMALLFSTAFDLMRSALFLYGGRKDLLRAILKAYGDILTSMPELLTRRRIVQSGRLMTHSEMKPFFASLAFSAHAYWKILKLQGGSDITG